MPIERRGATAICKIVLSSASLLAAGFALLSAGASQAQGPPAPPTILGVVPEAESNSDRTIVTGFVQKGADGSPLLAAGERIYELSPPQYPILLPYVHAMVRVVATELPGKNGRRLLLVHQIGRLPRRGE